MNETLLITRAADGDQQAFGELYDENVRFVFNVAARLMGDVAEAEDITQEVFLAAWRKLPNFKRESKFRTWLYRIAVNKSLNRINREKKKVNVDCEVLDTMVNLGKHDRLNSASVVENEITLAKLLNRLDPDKRAAIILSQLEGLSYDEVAEATGVAVGTIRSRISRAKEEMSKGTV